jgi:hypothetical protein
MKNLSQHFKSLVKSYRPLILPYIGVSALFAASCIFFMTTISVFSLLIPFSITLSSLLAMHALLWSIARVVLFPAAFLAPENSHFNHRSGHQKLNIHTYSPSFICLQAESNECINEDDTVVIGFNDYGRTFNFDHIPTFCNATTYKKVRFHYRGAEKNTGDFVSEKDLIEDGAAVILALLDQNVKPKNIILYGFSLGGAVATLSLAHLIKTQPKCTAIKLVSDRSFSSTSAMLGPYMNTLLYPVLKVLNLNFDAGDAWQHGLKDIHKVCFYANSNYGSLHYKAKNTETIPLSDDINHKNPLPYFTKYGDLISNASSILFNCKPS